MKELASPLERALSALDACSERCRSTITFRPRSSSRRGVYGGGAGLAYARLVLHPVAPLTRGDRDRIVLGLADSIRGQPAVADYLDGVGSELDLLARVARGTPVDVPKVASDLLPRLEQSIMEGRATVTDADLHGGIAGEALTLSCVARLSGLSPREDVIACLAKRLGATVLLAPRGLAIRSPGSRRPLLGLTHGASGVAWALEQVTSALSVGRLIAGGLRSYIASREDDCKEGWLDDRNDPRAPSAANSSYCHGSFGIYLAAAPGAKGARTRRRAMAHMLREANAGGTRSLAVCHGDPTTLSALRSAGHRQPADVLRRQIDAALHAHELDDVGDGLFTSALGALVCLVLDEHGCARPSASFPWLPATRHLRPLGSAFEAMLDSAASATLPESSRAADRETLRSTFASAASGELYASAFGSGVGPIAAPVSNDIARARLYWTFSDDVAVKAAAKKERASGREAVRGMTGLGADVLLVTSRRIGFPLPLLDRAPTIVVHEGESVESVEVDEEIFGLLHLMTRPMAIGELEFELGSLRRSIRPREVIGALLVLGYLTIAPSSKEPYA